LENVQYAPTYGRYKVYLIDEVHMLSGHSFNALLKTLEEPPPHIKFLLATTDPQKLPMTVLSRCLQFNLKRMSVKQISGHLAHMLKEEGIAADEDALLDLAIAADGSMRDALSLLDQAIGFGDGQVRGAEVREMLGAVPREHMHKLASALAQGDLAGALQAVTELGEQGVDLAGVLIELLSLLHQIALAQAVSGSVDDTYPYAALAERLAHELKPEDVQLYYQIALIGRRDLPLAADPRSGLEMVLLRMLSFNPLVRARSDEAKVAARPAVGERSGIGPPAGATESAPAQHNQHNQTQVAFEDQDWPQLLNALQLKGVAFALASNCSLKSLSMDEVRLVLGERHAEIRATNAEARLRQALSDYFSRPLRLRIEIAERTEATPAELANERLAQQQRAAETAIEADTTIQAFKTHFDAEIIPGSIRPLKEW
jgi:DNA polymerase-3 subunit gamma/tau